MTITKFDIAPFLQQLSQVKCQPFTGGIPGNEIGAETYIYSSTAPTGFDAQSKAGFPLFATLQLGDISALETKSTEICVTVG